jgi:peptidoglycan-N-acetylglucosamine deacetylase
VKKTICFTIDVEPDFGGLLPKNEYFGKDNLPELERIVRKYNIKLTAFATGKTLEDNPDIIESLRSMKAEVEQHSYSHQIGHLSKIKDIEKGIQIHEKLVGSPPLGYRAPQGIITHEEALLLDHLGIKFDSSIFPAFFPGRFNSVGFPVIPFRVKESNLIEIPFAVVPKIRIPIGLSYMQLLGLNTFKFFFKVFGLPELIVYDFHTYELGRVPSYSRLPMLEKFIYYRAQKMYCNPANVFEDFVKYILSKDYESKYMIDVYKEIKSKVSIWKWN